MNEEKNTAVENNTTHTEAPAASTSTWKDDHPEVGALWIKMGREQKYMSGYVESENGDRTRVIIYSNKYKESNSNAPDFRVYRAKDNAGPQSKSHDPLDSLSGTTSAVEENSGLDEESLL